MVKKSLDNIQKKSIEELNFRISLLESYDPSDLFSTEIKQIFEKTLSELPPKTRQAFELSRLECKTYKEIAEIMEISVKGVDYHMTAALKKFRVTLKDYLPVLFFL